MDFYINAAKALDKLDAKQGSIKGLTLQSGTKDASRLYALVLETLKYREILRDVISRSDIAKKERKLGGNATLLLVLVHDFLLNKRGIIANGGPFKDAVMRHKTRLNAEWIKAKLRHKVQDHKALAKVDQVFLPRWIRCNPLRIDRDVFATEFKAFTTVDDIGRLNPDCIYNDPQIPDLYALHPDQSITTHARYLDGSIVFQNKASCIPAFILNPSPGDHVIDACAAPGNKTSHLAALMQNTGKLFAFERDNKRVPVLRNMMIKANAQVEVIHQDFTRIDPYDERFKDVTHLLLDPSCSGSGIVNRLDYLTSNNQENDSEDVDQTRLDSLATFQLAIILHAMKFPNARKISYSTCSIHATENEHVVMEVLRQSQEWTLCPRNECMPTWPHRGLASECDGDEELSQSMIRAKPGDEGTIGFFVACFKRRDTKKKKSKKRKRK